MVAKAAIAVQDRSRSALAWTRRAASQSLTPRFVQPAVSSTWLDIAMRIGPLVLVVALFALLASVILYAWTGLTSGSTAMPTEGYIALVAGVTVSVVVGVGLMALVFYSSRHGYDDLPKRDDEPE